MFDDRPFFNIAGIGLDAHIARLFNQRPRGTPRPLALRRHRRARKAVRYVAREYSITLDGRTHRSQALIIAFANGQEYGIGDADCAAAHRPDDGLLEACVVEDRSVLARFRDARHLALGSMHRAPRMVMQPIRTAVVETRASRSSITSMENPMSPAIGVTVTIRPGALVVKV